MQKITSRLAPSPTGFLHLGNAWSFVLCWLITRSMRGEVLLRIDDLDPERSRAQYVEKIMEDLIWLGLDWDRHPGGEGDGIYYQSKRRFHYERALDILQKNSKLYPCFCSRKELRMLASAPHADTENAGHCPCRFLEGKDLAMRLEQRRPFSLKFKNSATKTSFTDLLYGNIMSDEETSMSDFALKRSDGVYAYQLASVVDDALMGVNLVVRGNDLLESTPRQLALINELGYSAPLYAHVPLILDGEGERLAKRHGSLAISALRRQGVKSSRIVGQFAYWAKLQPDPRPLEIKDALELFSLQHLPTQNIFLPGDFIFSGWNG